MADYEVRRGYFYTEGDTWVCRGEDGTVRFGVTDYAQKKLKAIEYLSLPDEGEAVEQNASLGEVESKKAVSELLSPVSGTVEAVNGAAVDEPGLLNRDPYGEGWILALQCPDFEAQTAGLMDAGAYEKFLEEKELKK